MNNQIFKVKKLGNLIKLSGGGTPDKSNSSYWNGNIPWASVKDLKSDEINFTQDSITEEGVVNSATRVIKKDSLIIATRMAVGKVAINKIDLAINQDLKAIQCNSENIDKKFLFYYLKNKSNYFERIATGATVKGIKISHILDLQIPLPPLATQKKIAAILDAADAYRQKTKALIGKYEQLGQSLFLEMFGDPVVNPKGWDVNPVIKYCSCIVPGRDKPKSFTGNIPWITTNQLNHLRYTTKENFELGLTEYEIEQVRAKVIPKNSVIITCVGDLGIVSINKLDIVINQQLHAFVCNKVINNVFLMYNISFQKPYMYKMASSTTVPYMNKKVANNIPTIYPPLHLQNQFAERSQAIELQKAKAEESLGKAEALFGVLLQRAFKGELV